MYLWLNHFLSQHYNRFGNTVTALEYIDKAIDHTPTLPELYMTKAKIIKVRPFHCLPSFIVDIHSSAHLSLMVTYLFILHPPAHPAHPPSTCSSCSSSIHLLILHLPAHLSRMEVTCTRPASGWKRHSHLILQTDL